MKEEIERALAPLVRLTLWGPARAANMLSLQCGPPRRAPTSRDPHREVGAFAVHVFCPWRLVCAESLVSGSGDLLTPAEPEADLETFDWDKVGATWWDLRLRQFFDEHAAALPRIERVSADAVGGFRLHCSGNVVFEVFPSSSAAPQLNTEFWRLLSPGTAAPHFVVETTGVRSSRP